MTSNYDNMISAKIFEYELQDELNSYPNIILGESAGLCIQFKKYFITEDNNG